MKVIAAATVLSLGLMVPGTHMWVTGTETGAEEEVLLEVETPDTVAEESSETESAAEETAAATEIENAAETETEAESESETEAAAEMASDTVTVTEVETDTEADETEISEAEEVTESQLLNGASDGQPAEGVEEPKTAPAENEADSEKEPLLLGKTAAYSDVESAALVVREGMKNRQNVVTLSYVSGGTLDEAKAAEIGKSIYDKAIAHTGVPDEGDYLKWHRAVTQQISVQSLETDDDTTSFVLVFSFEYTSGPDEEDAVDQAAAEVMETLALDQYDTDYEKVYAIYDYICQNVDYWEGTARSAYYILSHSAYAAFVNNEAVCQGYALMFYRLALTAGIDNRLISGTAADSGVAHGWNIVKIGDQYYEVDATWDAGKQAYDYFLLGSERFKETNHTTHSNYTKDSFTRQYPLGLTYVFPNGEAHTHIDSGWISDGSGLEDTHHSWCYLCGDIEATEPHNWDEGQLVTFDLYEGETIADVDAGELLAADEGAEAEIREVTARVYTCQECGEMHIEEAADDEIVPEEDQPEVETDVTEEEEMEDVPVPVIDIPMNPLPASIDKHTVEAEDDEPVLLEEKTVREIPKTRTPSEDPVDTSDPAQFGADIFLMITAFAVMTACLPFMKKKRRQ